MASAPQRSRRRSQRARGGGVAMTRTHARGACPGLSVPMETGDGLLVRLMPAGPIPLDTFIGLCQ
ncbi:MAG: hypothetical protein ACRECM_00945, partial [Methyloceanibacter sp.]